MSVCVCVYMSRLCNRMCACVCLVGIRIYECVCDSAICYINKNIFRTLIFFYRVEINSQQWRVYQAEKRRKFTMNMCECMWYLRRRRRKHAFKASNNWFSICVRWRGSATAAAAHISIIFYCCSSRKYFQLKSINENWEIY